MEKISIKEILDATGGKLVSGSTEDFVLGVKHDSRECEKDDMFVAVIGENQDGHSYTPAGDRKWMQNTARIKGHRFQ